MIVYLKPHASFAQAVPRSDTLFGAVAWAIRLLYGESALAELLGQFDAALQTDAAPPFVISSLFPYLQHKGSKLRFLPRPLQAHAQMALTSSQKFQLAKKLKQTALLSEAVFVAVASGELNDDSVLDELLKGKQSRFALHGGALITQAELGGVRLFPSLYSNGETARNAINRLSASTGDDGGQLFFTPIAAARALDAIEAHTGFYCRIRLNDAAAPGIDAKLKAAMRFLGEKGFGGDVSVGRGHCEIEIDETGSEIGCDDGERLVLLSLLHPSTKDRAHFTGCQPALLARLERRKGFLESAFAASTLRFWKPTLVMLGEGATFPRDGNRRIYGSLFTDLSPRDGIQFQPRINGLGYVVPLAAKEATA
jgi:CRISPR-associated protein Csm4